MEQFGRFLQRAVPRLSAQAIVPRVSHQQLLYHDYSTQAQPEPIVNRRTECDYEELSNMLAFDDIALIDVRSEAERLNHGSIPGAIHIPLNEVKTALSMTDEDFTNHFYLPKPMKKGKNLIFYARGPNASSAAVEIAHRLGYKGSRQYSGGWEDYCKQTGLPMKKNEHDQDYLGSFYM